MNDFIITKALFIKLFNDFQSWAWTNSVIVNAGGFTIGYTTYHFITKFLNLIAPIFKLINKNIEKIGKSLGINSTGIIYNILLFIYKFIIEIIIWLFTIIITFLLLEYFLNNKLLGLKSNIKSNEKKEFIISKAEASQYNSIGEEGKKILEKNEKEKILGKIIIKDEELNLNKLNTNNINGKNELEILSKNDNYDKIISNIT